MTVKQSDESLQSIAPSAEQADRAIDLPHGGFDPDHPPALVGADTLAVIWGVSVSQIYKRAKRGEFDRFKVQFGIGPKVYSGALLARYVKGERVAVETFGRKRVS